MLELKNAQEKRMKDIIGIYAQESGDDGWVLNTKELQDIYNNGLPKKRTNRYNYRLQLNV